MQIRDNVNFSSPNVPLQYNVSVLIMTNDENNRIVEKYLMIHVKDKRDFELILTNDEV